ncbi:hypothetical protein ACOSQ4_001932 [Xanthoceras sorbifolium]
MHINELTAQIYFSSSLTRYSPVTLSKRKTICALESSSGCWSRRRRSLILAVLSPPLVPPRFPPSPSFPPPLVSFHFLLFFLQGDSVLRVVGVKQATNFTEHDYASRPYLIGKVHGLQKAENVFEKIPVSC